MEDDGEEHDERTALTRELAGSEDDGPEPEEGGSGDGAVLATPKKKGTSKAKGQTGAASAKAGAKAGKNTAKAKTPKKGKFQCRGCRKFFDGEVFGVNNIFCPQDKKALDRLSTLAKNQGAAAVKFVSDARQDPDVVYDLLSEYYKACPPPTAGQRMARGQGKWSIVQHMEELEAETGVINDAIGVMMWKGQYIEFCKSASGGFRSEVAAAAEWELMKAKWEKKPDDFVWDKRSPNESEPLRLRIVEKDVVINRNAMTQRKKLVLQQRAVKRASDEDVQKMKRQCLAGHDLHTLSADSNLNDIAQRMVKSSGASAEAFSGDSFSITDVMAFQKPEQEEMDADSDQEPQKKPAEDSASTSAGSTRQTGSSKCSDEGWFDTRIAAAAKRSMTKSVELAEVSLKKTVRDLDAVIKQIKSLPDVQAARFVDEKKIAVTRHDMLSLVLHGAHEDLQKSIRSFQGGMGASAKMTIGNAPPSRHFASLVPWEYIKVELEKYDAASSKEDLDKIQKQIGIWRRPIHELERAAKDAMADLVKAQDDFKAHEEHKSKIEAAAAGQAATKRKAKRGSSSTVLESGPAHGTEATSVATAGDVKNLPSTTDWTMPLLIPARSHEFTSFHKPSGENDKIMQRLLDKLCSDMEGQRGAQGAAMRGQRSCGEDTAQIAEDAFSEILPHAQWLKPAEMDHAEVKAACTWAAFAMMPSAEPWSGAEKAHLGAVRYSYKGTRSIVMTPGTSLYEFIQLRNPGVKPSFADLWHFFKSMDGQTMEQYVAKGAPGEGALVFCTVGPGDIIIVPPVWVVAEKVVGTDPCIGLRRSFLQKGDAAGVAKLRVVLAELAGSGKAGTPSYQIIENALKLADPGGAEPKAAEAAAAAKELTLFQSFFKQAGAFAKTSGIHGCGCQLCNARATPIVATRAARRSTIGPIISMCSAFVFGRAVRNNTGSCASG